jgi:hypothetical protein
MNRPRTPQEIEKLLRREVNFGCPVPGCGSPWLKYHHFAQLGRNATISTQRE